jgi:hypothetical protein
MTVTEYAALRGISTQAVRKAIKMSYKLPGVLSHRKSGNVHLLTVQVDQINQTDKS